MSYNSIHNQKDREAHWACRDIWYSTCCWHQTDGRYFFDYKKWVLVQDVLEMSWSAWQKDCNLQTIHHRSPVRLVFQATMFQEWHLRFLQSMVSSTDGHSSIRRSLACP